MLQVTTLFPSSFELRHAFWFRDVHQHGFDTCWLSRSGAKHRIVRALILLLVLVLVLLILVKENRGTPSTLALILCFYLGWTLYRTVYTVVAGSLSFGPFVRRLGAATRASHRVAEWLDAWGVVSWCCCMHRQ